MIPDKYRNTTLRNGLTEQQTNEVLQAKINQIKARHGMNPDEDPIEFVKRAPLEAIRCTVESSEVSNKLLNESLYWPDLACAAMLVQKLMVATSHPMMAIIVGSPLGTIKHHLLALSARLMGQAFEVCPDDATRERMANIINQDDSDASISQLCDESIRCRGLDPGEVVRETAEAMERALRDEMTAGQDSGDGLGKLMLLDENPDADFGDLDGRNIEA